MKDPIGALRALLDFCDESVLDMSDDEIDAELREAGIDPDAIQRRVASLLAKHGISINAGRSTNRREGNRLAESDTRFEDWPGAGIGENES